MAPVVCSDDNAIDHKHFLFEASVLHRIPPELFIQSSSSTRYLQSFPNGKSYRSWLWNRRKDRKEERLRKLARFHAELSSKLMTREKQSDNNRVAWDAAPNASDDSKENKNPVDRDELLLDIALKTMVLMHHNRLLQNKINALQVETRNFVKSCHSRRHQRANETASTIDQ